MVAGDRVAHQTSAEIDEAEGGQLQSDVHTGDEECTRGDQARGPASEVATGSSSRISPRAASSAVMRVTAPDVSDSLEAISTLASGPSSSSRRRTDAELILRMSVARRALPELPNAVPLLLTTAEN